MRDIEDLDHIRKMLHEDPDMVDVDYLWKKLREDHPDLLLTILAYLPIKTLVEIFTVSRKWNALLQDRGFQKLWGNIHGGHQYFFYQHFIKEVLVQGNRKNFRKLIVSVDGFLLTCGSDRYSTSYDSDLLVMNPSNASVQIISPINCYPAYDERYLEICEEIETVKNVVGMVLDPPSATRNYSIFVTTHKIRSNVNDWQEPDRFFRYRYNRRLDYNVMDSPVAVFRYDSKHRSWCWCGNLPTPKWGGIHWVEGVAMHQNRYTVLVGIISYTSFHQSSRTRYEVRCYLEYVIWDKCWEQLPGGELPPSEFSSPYLFDYSGQLFLAVFLVDGCSLWTYHDETLEWIQFDLVSKAFLEHDVIKKIRDGRDEGCSDTKCLAAQRLGDFLYLGRRSSVPEEKSWEVAMKYDLITGSCREVTLEEQEQRLINLQYGNSLFYEPTARGS